MNDKKVLKLKIFKYLITFFIIIGLIFFTYGFIHLFEIDKPIYHVATGANIKIGTTYLTTGLALSYANHTLESSNLIEDTVKQKDLEGNLPADHPYKDSPPQE